MPAPKPRSRRRKPLDAGPFAPEIDSFRLHRRRGRGAQDDADLHRAVRWFAAAYLLERADRSAWD